MGYRMIIGVLSGLYVYAVPKVLSRTNNKTLSCLDCGTCEALAGIGLKADNQKQIISTIPRHTESRIWLKNLQFHGIIPLTYNNKSEFRRPIYGLYLFFNNYCRIAATHST